MKKVLVFGGLGFIGSNFVRWALENRLQIEIKVADAFTYAADPGRLPADFDGEVRKCRLQDPENYQDLMKWADVVVNFAAETHNDNSLVYPELFVDSNVVGTLRLLESCRENATKIIQVSTDEVYGDFPLASKEKATEQYPLRPSSPYSSSKASADLLVLAWSRSYGVSAMITRCTNNFGPGQHVEKLIPRVVSQIKKGKPVELYGDGTNVRDWIHVNDHSSAIGMLVKTPIWGQVFNISANQEMSNLELVHLIAKGFDSYPHPIRFVEDRPGHDLRYSLDSSKIRSAGWKPKHSLDSVLFSSF